MTRSAKTTVTVNVKSDIKNVSTDLNVNAATASIGGKLVQLVMANGAEANQANRAWSRRWTISSGGSEVFDVYDLGSVDIGAGAGNDSLGQAWVCEEIVVIVIVHVGGSGSLEVNLTNPTNHLGWTPNLTVANGGALRANGFWMMSNSDAGALDVTDASSNEIRLTATGGDVTLELMIVGRSDDEVSSSSGSSSSTSSSTSTNSSSVSSSSSSSSSSISSSSTSTVSSVSSSTLSSSST